MKNLQNDTLQNFLDKVVDELKREKEYNRLKNDQLDIPFIISSIYQSFKNNTDRYKDFIEDLDKYSDYGLYIEDSQNDYNGLVDIGITLVKYINDANYPEFTDYDNPDYDYKFTLTYDERNWGYCECTPDMSDYREDKHKSFHLNLYAIDKDGNEVLMTKDHIIPKSKGGIDDLSNYQTMCERCNKEKGNELEK